MSAQAALHTAELNLEWSEVRAPISGRVSDRRVDPGNLVTGGQNGATMLTTIVRLDPIYFVFDGSEADYHPLHPAERRRRSAVHRATRRTRCGCSSPTKRTGRIRA